MAEQLPPVDSVLVISFGGPEGPADVLPFLDNVTRGRGVPSERLAEVAGHYLEVFGGVSPLNAQARSLVAALQNELRERGPDLPVYWGNRNWHPYLADTLAGMARDGRRHAVSLTTSAFPSYSGCRQYFEDIVRAREDVPDAPVVTRLRQYHAEEGFLAPMVRNTAEALQGLGAGARVVFTAHSVPTSMAESSGPAGNGYVTTLRAAAAAVMDRLATGHQWDLVFQSRSGSPAIPWLEPDVEDHLVALHSDGVTEVVLVPIGFTSDHVEVVYDLDVAARKTADTLPGLTLRRATTVGTAPEFIGMLRDLVVERLAAPALLGVDTCAATCCPALVSRRPQPPRPPD